MSALLRNPFHFALAASAAAVMIVACSSSSTSAPIPADDGDSSTPGPGSDSAAADPDASMPDPSGDSSTVPDGAAAPFKLTSSALTEGASFAANNTCTGTNVSPPFAWGPGPAATKSYAIVLMDKTNSLIHAIIYDMPASVTSLAANYPAAYAPATPAGAHESKNYKGVFGYAGPCPPAEHVYEFALTAVDVATLPALTQNSTTAEIQAAIKAHSVATTTLTGKYKQP